MPPTSPRKGSVLSATVARQRFFEEIFSMARIGWGIKKLFRSRDNELLYTLRDRSRPVPSFRRRLEFRSRLQDMCLCWRTAWCSRTKKVNKKFQLANGLSYRHAVKTVVLGLINTILPRIIANGETLPFFFYFTKEQIWKILSNIFDYQSSKTNSSATLFIYRCPPLKDAMQQCHQNRFVFHSHFQLFQHWSNSFRSVSRKRFAAQLWESS